MYFFTADEHYFHKNIIEYSNRPFDNIEQMHKTLIMNHNEIVSTKDITIHAGDVSFTNRDKTLDIIRRLNGIHVLLRGSHDKWMNSTYHEIWQKTIEDIHIVVCHYAMLTWPKSHFGSIQLFGHSHGKLGVNHITGRQMDIGVDTNSFYPYSFDHIKKELKL